MPGSQTFFIQHDHTIDERYSEPPDPTNHSNGVIGISSLSLAVRDSDAAARRWTEVFGLARVSEEVGCVRLRFENSTLDFCQPDRDDALEAFIETWGEGPYRIVFSCKDLDATDALLKGNGVEGVERRGGGLCVPPESAQGVGMSFV